MAKTTLNLETEVVKNLKNYRKNYYIKGKGKGETASIQESLEQLEKSYEEVQQLLKSGDKKYQETMAKNRTNGERGFYLLEYLVYWCMITREKIEKLNSNEYLSETELAALKVVVEILEVKEEMIRQCVAGKIPNRRLNDTAISEVIHRLPAELYDVGDYITMIKKAMFKKEHAPNILKRGTYFIKSKILGNQKYKVAKIAAKQEQTPKNREIIRFMENDEIVFTSPQELRSLNQTKDSIKIFPVNKKYKVAEVENAAKQEQTPKNMKNINAIKNMLFKTQNVINKERKKEMNKVHQVFIHSH